MTAKDPLSVTHPELAKQADGWDPSTLSQGSGKKVGWKCSKGHHWEYSINHRASRGDGCPVCSGRKVEVGFNDLRTTHPELASEADGWDPMDYTSASSKVMEWVCVEGHNWEIAISTRTKWGKSNCPVCSGHKVATGFNDLATTNPTLALEADGWDPKQISAGSGKRVPWKCLYGHQWVAPIFSRSRGNGCPVCANLLLLEGVNDLATTHPTLAPETDGWDPRKIISSAEKKFAWKCSLGHKWLATVPSRKNGSGCPVCAGQKVEVGFNDLATTNPDIAAQAVGWDPELFSRGSGQKLEWQCLEGHFWISSIASRALLNTGCPICAGQKVEVGFNDLATTNPEIASQAYGWDPTLVTSGTSLRRKWVCHKGHLWDTSIAHRTSLGKETGCPVCAGKKVEVGFNDLATTNPEIASQAYGWDPTLVIGGSTIRRKWRCEKGHEWEISATSRISKKAGCPICSNNKVLVGFNDLATTNPDIANQAIGWDPREYSFGSGVSKKWRCEKGHEWSAVIGSRLKKENGCPFCSGHKVLKGFNDLSTTHPNLALEAVGWDPTAITGGSNKNLRWRGVCGHEWKTMVATRTGNLSGCPVCANLQILVGFNDLATTHPWLAKEAKDWDTSTVVAGSPKKRRWVCTEGHEWNATIAHRSNGRGCPSCAKSGFDPNKDGYLYFLQHTGWEMFQIGITNFPDDRLGSHKRLGWEVLELRGPMDGHLTQQWETSILRMLKAKGADLSNTTIAGKFDGYSEAWSKPTFEVRSIKELMRLTEEFEES